MQSYGYMRDPWVATRRPLLDRFGAAEYKQPRFE